MSGMRPAQKAIQLLILLLINSTTAIFGQHPQARWKRVYTGDDYIIEIDPSSLKFESEQTLRVVFRTTLAKPESLDPNNSTKYKSRLETILFKLPAPVYRFDDVKWLDSNGNVIHNSVPGAAHWRTLKHGGIMERMFLSIRTLKPFGNWKVIDYRVADSAAHEATGSEDLSRLVGQEVRVDVAQAQVGAKVCQLPAYQSRRFTNREFLSEMGIQLASIGIASENAEAIIIKCKDGWAPPQSMLIELPQNRFLMLWEGVFLVLDHK